MHDVLEKEEGHFIFWDGAVSVGCCRGLFSLPPPFYAVITYALAFFLPLPFACHHLPDVDNARIVCLLDATGYSSREKRRTNENVMLRLIFVHFVSRALPR